MRSRPQDHTRPTRITVGLAVTALLGVAAAGYLVWWREPADGLQHAARLAPEGTQRLSWTHWADVRAAVGADLGPDPSTEAVAAMLDAAYDRDLSSTSALVQSAPVLTERFGLGPGTLDWELYAQSSAGAVDLLGLPEEFDADALRDRLTGLGFEPPEDDEGVWRGGADLLPRIGPDLTPELQYLAVLDDAGLVLASDRSTYLETAVEVVRGDAAHLAGLDGVLRASGAALSASVLGGDYACERLAMAGAGADAQAEAGALLRAAGEVHPLTGFALSAQPDGGLRLAMSVESEDDVESDAQTRARLAAGPAPGQGGDFTDRFEVDGVSTRGDTLELDLTPLPGQYVLSDLSSGPVLFATC